MNAKYFITAVAIYLAISSYTIRSQHSDYYYVDEYEYVYEEVSADGSYYYLYDDDYEDEDTNHVGSPEPHDRSHLSQDMPASPGIATKKKRIPVGANPDFYYGYDIEDEEEVTAPVEVKKRKKVEIKTSIINPEFIHEVARANHHCLPHGESEELWSLRHNATIQSSEAAKQQQSAGTPSQDTSKSKPPPAFRIPLGADCEALSCGSCRVIVEEFAKSLHPINVTDRMAHISDLDVLKKFCQSGPVRLKYSAMTEGICLDFANDDLGYGYAMLTEFEVDLDKNLSSALVIDKQKKICAAAGACSAIDFEISTAPTGTEQEHWDETCFVCQAFAKELEIRAHLSRDVMSDDRAIQTVKDICHTLNLPAGSLNDTCWSLISIPSKLEDIAWIGKLHGEVIKNVGKGDIRFGDKMCQEMAFCTKWVDPEELKRQQAIEEMPPVFF